MNNQQEQYQEWTPCQMYGHKFVQDENNPHRYVCEDCGESYENG